MSEQPKKSPGEDKPPWPTGEPDDSEPSPERQAELRAAYEENIKVGKPPYAGVTIRTRGEVSWIVRERKWRAGDFGSLEQAIDFRRVGFRKANLSGLRLLFANLNGAFIGNTNFAGADFSRSSLNGAFIGNTNFAGARLIQSDWSGTFISNTNFADANFTTADMSGAFIFGINCTGAALVAANMSGAVFAGDLTRANLTQARMDSSTVLGGTGETDRYAIIHIDTATRLLDVAWNGAILANIQWEQVPRLGDEQDIKAAIIRKKRVQALRDAARAYRGLAKALQAQGLTIPALKYRTREQQLERKALFWNVKPGQWFFSWLLNIVSGYGDRPGRALACYIGVVTAFAAAYFALTNGLVGFITTHSTRLAWYEALVLSISSFHGRGFFPSVPSLGDPVAIVAAAEAIIGLFIELVFIATFTQRFFAR